MRKLLGNFVKNTGFTVKSGSKPVSNLIFDWTKKLHRKVRTTQSNILNLIHFPHRTMSEQLQYSIAPLYHHTFEYLWLPILAATITRTHLRNQPLFLRCQWAFPILVFTRLFACHPRNSDRNHLPNRCCDATNDYWY